MRMEMKPSRSVVVHVQQFVRFAHLYVAISVNVRGLLLMIVGSFR